MVKEITAGIVIAVTVYLMRIGYDITPLLAVGLLCGVLYYTLNIRGIGKRFEVLGGGENATVNSCITFSDIGGQEVAKREVLEAIEFVKDIDSVKELGIRPLKGILLTGPPGTGKTLLAKAAANYIGSVFVATSGSEFVEMYAGVGAQRVRQLFAKARSVAEKKGAKSSIVFIDEIDVIGGKRGTNRSHLEYDQTLNQLLVAMDGITSDDGIRTLVIGATNRLDLLDPALLRPGRFDRIINVDLPDKEGRLNILKIHTKNKPLADDVVLEAIAKETFGFSGAHLETLANEAAIIAMRRKKSRLSATDFREALEKVLMGEKLDRRPNKEELMRIAVHETGHAVISEEIRPKSVSSITVTSRGKALGYMRQIPEDDLYLYTKDYLEGQICVLVAGAIAEEMYYGNRSTGAANDFQKAAQIGRKIVTSGLSELGVISEEDVPRSLVHTTINKIIREQEKRVTALLENKKERFQYIISELLENEHISGNEFRRLIVG